MDKEVYGPMGIESQIGFVIRSEPSRVVGFALARWPSSPTARTAR